MGKRKIPVITKQWNNYIDLHKGKDFIICGRGRSIHDLKEIPENTILIGVNDIEKYIKVKYLIVVDRMAQFAKENRHKEIIYNKADTLFTQIKELGVGYSDFNYNKVCMIDVKRITNDSNINKNICLASNNSTFIACSMAINMGAKNIGMIGVDIEGHKSLHSDTALKKINRDFTLLNKLHKIYNLSKNSKIKALEKININDFYKLNTITNG